MKFYILKELVSQSSCFKSWMKFYILKEIVSQSSCFKSRPNLVVLGGVGGGNRKSWITLRVERSGQNLVGRICTSLRYVIEITRSDPLSLGK